jgi:hypothetical protein
VLAVDLGLAQIKHRYATEGTIKCQFPLKKDMEHFPRKRKKLLFDSILRANELDASSLEIT